MAAIHPFRPYRYRSADLEPLLTQPYDKITPAMQRRYLELHPHNLVRLILGPRTERDSDADNVYTRAARLFEEWRASGVLVQEPAPCLMAYFQEFTLPDSGERLLRKGFIALGPVEEYSAGIVHRHEQTLSGPKRDRLELLRHTRAHFEQLFLLYSDPEGAVDRLLDEAATAPPLVEVRDEYGALHRLWRIGEPERIACIQRLMESSKLLIADGHHRYETALEFRRRHPELEDARRVQMTLFNLHSPGLRILATHRLVSGLEGLDVESLLARLDFSVTRLPTRGALRAALSGPHPGRARIGLAWAGGAAVLETARGEDDLDVNILHRRLIERALGITAEAVRDEKHLRYVRGLDAAVDEVERGEAQLAFLLEPVPVEQVARMAFAGGVLPQKSTDFYPKLLSGLTIYRLEA